MQNSLGTTLRPRGWRHIFAAIFFCAAVAQAQTFTTLADFSNTVGGGPGSPLIQGLDGNFYGTAGDSGSKGHGAVFVATSSGSLTDLFTFCKAATCPTGANPYMSLLQVANGDFFGFTLNIDNSTSNNGTLFRLSPSGVINNLHTFGGNCCYPTLQPRTNLIQARNGDLYGTTSEGGYSYAGTIFKVTTAGALTTVYDFCYLVNCKDGENPVGFGALIQATDGNLYGATRVGGEGDGTIYQLSPSGTLKTIYKFCKVAGCTDGSNPNGLVEGLDGNFYGTTTGGGANGDGEVFKITSFGTLTVLYSFCSQPACSDGNGPTGLLLGSDGNFYGTTANLGSNGAVPNTIFQVTPAGAYTLLYSTDTETQSSVLSIMQSTDGNFYGTNSIGGANGLGTFFKLSTGLGPFVQALRPYGDIGQTAYILGTGLTGSTSVTFNGVAATTFSVVSDSEIAAVIPAGASTGTLQVVTPGGTLSSVVEFQVFE